MSYSCNKKVCSEPVKDQETDRLSKFLRLPPEIVRYIALIATVLSKSRAASKIAFAYRRYRYMRVFLTIHALLDVCAATFAPMQVVLISTGRIFLRFVYQDYVHICYTNMSGLQYAGIESHVRDDMFYLTNAA